MAKHTVDDVLEQSGVKGQRWGIRRSRASLEAHRSPDSAAAALAAHKAKHGGVTSLSNDELTVLTKRIKLEQEFTKLTKPGPSRGKRFLDAATKSAAAADSVIKIMNGPTGKLIKDTLATSAKKTT